MAWGWLAGAPACGMPPACLRRARLPLAPLHAASRAAPPPFLPQVRYLGSYRRPDALWIAMEFCGGGSVSDLIAVRGLGGRAAQAAMQRGRCHAWAAPRTGDACAAWRRGQRRAGRSAAASGWPAERGRGGVEGGRARARGQSAASSLAVGTACGTMRCHLAGPARAARTPAALPR